VDMHHPLLYLNDCIYIYGFFYCQNFVACRVSLLQKWKISWVTVRERRSKDSITVDVDCNYAAVSNTTSEQ
jgi:hypothetical protein